MLQRLYYTAEKGVARVGRRRSRLPLRPTRAGASFQQRALEARLLSHRKHQLIRGTPAPHPRREAQRLYYKRSVRGAPSVMARPARASRAGLTFLRRALNKRLLVKRETRPSPVTPALSSRRMLQRLHYMGQNGVAPRRAGDARGSTRASLTLLRRASSERILVRRVPGSSPVTPAPLSDRILQRVRFTAIYGVARVGRESSRLRQGRPTFFATRFKQAPSCPEGDWA